MPTVRAGLMEAPDHEVNAGDINMPDDMVDHPRSQRHEPNNNYVGLVWSGASPQKNR